MGQGEGGQEDKGTRNRRDKKSPYLPPSPSPCPPVLISTAPVNRNGRAVNRAGAFGSQK